MPDFLGFQAIDAALTDSFNGLFPSIGPHHHLPSDSPSEVSGQDLGEVQALGWGVNLEITLPHQARQPQEQREKIVLKDGNDLVLFKESQWMGKWRGYFFTSILHEGKHLTGYKLDQASEPTDTWSGPRPHKYFGLKGDILGYHYDARGPAPCHDPASDSLLLQMGWGRTQVHDQPDVNQPVPPVQPASLTENPNPAPSPCGAEPVPPAQPASLTEAFVAKLNEKAMNNAMALDFKGVEPGKPATTRRAAYNALVRLKNNPARLKEVDPVMRQKLLESNQNVPSDLITDLVKCGGDLDALSATFTESKETSTFDQDSSKLKPLTEIQIVQMYGEAEAKNVMAHKTASGMTQDDPNNPGKMLYLMMSEERPNQLYSVFLYQISFIRFSCQEDWIDHKE